MPEDLSHFNHLQSQNPLTPLARRPKPPALAQRFQREEAPLRTAQRVRGLEEPRARHGAQLPGVRLEPYLVAREWLAGVLDGEAFLGEPQGGLAPPRGNAPRRRSPLEDYSRPLAFPVHVR